MAVAGSLGLGRSAAQASFGLAGTFVEGRLDADVSALACEFGELTISGALDVVATDEADLIGIAGAVGKGSVGLGVAMVHTVTEGRILAQVDGARPPATGPAPAGRLSAGLVSVSAKAERDLVAIAAGIGVATDANAKFAGAGSIAVNEIETDVLARFDRITARDVPAPVSFDGGIAGNLSVTAIEDSSIVSISGSVAASKSAAATIGAAIGYNLIDRDVLAEVDQATLDVAGSVAVLALSAPAMLAVAGAGAVALGQKSIVAGAGAVLVNRISGGVLAQIEDATVDALLDIRVDASSAPTMRAISVGGSLTVGGKVSVGAAVAYNYLGGRFDFDAATSDDDAPATISIASDAATASGGRAARPTVGPTVRARCRWIRRSRR